MKKILAPLFAKVLLASATLQVLGQFIAHVPLVTSRASDPNCIDNLADCRLRADQILASVGYWLALISYVAFAVAILLIPIYVLRRIQKSKHS